MVSKKILIDLFKKCNKLTDEDKYLHTNEGGSYFLELKNKGKTLKIWFEKSNGKADWWNNFDFISVPYKEMKDTWKVHSGFFRVWDSIKPYIEEIFKNNPSISKVQIVGYSHGGPMTVFCHEWIRFNYPDVKVESYAFGCPRVIYGKPSEAVLSRWDNFYRIRNYDDIVTHVPPKIFGCIEVGHGIDVTPKKYFHKKERNIINKYIAGHFYENIIDGINNYDGFIK